jgi:excinuclease UvrABC nuclease subunit
VPVFAYLCPSNKLPLEWVGPLLCIAEEVERIPRGITGIYMLQHFDSASAAYPIFYVGKSADLRRRLFQHGQVAQRKPAARIAAPWGQVYFCAAPVPLRLLDHVEAGLIQMLRPVLNDLVPSMAPIHVNLPLMRLYPKDK